MSDDTTTLLINGLNGEGPGDIVGAVANEANVPPDALGAIDLDDGTATVDVHGGVADRIVEALDGGRVGTSTVSIARLDAETKSARAYADRLTDLVEMEREVEVDTVDGFQGREKEVVLVSLVRSNDRAEIGFLDEPRRFNVAVTRARRKAVVVGDADTVSEGDVFDRLIQYAGTEGRIVRFRGCFPLPTGLRTLPS